MAVETWEVRRPRVACVDMASPPHILVFNPDQWRGDVLGHVGNPAAVTPVLDAFAASEAVSFRNAFCQNPVCTPSRCSFMTGWYPHVRGHRTMHHMLQPDEPMLLRTLKDHGYHVWWAGKNDVVPAQNGFGSYCSERFAAAPQARPRKERERDCDTSFFVGRLPCSAGERRVLDGDWERVDAAVERIRTYEGGAPLCLYLALGYPHPPYAVEEPWFSIVDRKSLPARLQPPGEGSLEPAMTRSLRRALQLGGWSESRWSELRATYYGMCARVDHQFGLVLQALREKGLYDETAVFFFSDHGDFTGDYDLVEKTQNTFEDCLVRVPFLFKPPRQRAVRPGVRGALVELVDFAATVFDLTGIEPGYTHFGRSLLPIVAGEADEHRDAVFSEGGRLLFEHHTRERESPGSTDPSNPYHPRMRIQAADGVEHGKAVMCRTRHAKYVFRLYEEDEFYDLTSDPGEQRNVIDDPGYRDAISTHRHRLMQFLVETGDVVPMKADRRW